MLINTSDRNCCFVNLEQLKGTLEMSGLSVELYKYDKDARKSAYIHATTQKVVEHESYLYMKPCFEPTPDSAKKASDYRSKVISDHYSKNKDAPFSLGFSDFEEKIEEETRKILKYKLKYIQFHANNNEVLDKVHSIISTLYNTDMIDRFYKYEETNSISNLTYAGKALPSMKLRLNSKL